MAVPDGHAPDGGSKIIEGSGGLSGGLGSSGLKSSLLSAGLVEPGPHISLPVFSPVNIGDGVVVLNHGVY